MTVMASWPRKNAGRVPWIVTSSRIAAKCHYLGTAQVQWLQQRQEQQKEVQKDVVSYSWCHGRDERLENGYRRH